jgi:four helix bundle protein
MKENIIVVKSFDFAVKVVKLFRKLTTEKNDWVLSKQFLRSGTSVGANIEEAVGGISKKDFISKLQISYKEARETRYWIRLLFATGYIDKSEHDSFIADIEEIIRIIVSILKTSKDA